ncbi:hypothetical protein STSP2_02505 [Anaerohalosphaera lusitana]|uniref:Uncharacterized protein n=1 Tax=Anaerohalosphaera lusitana TaxID=1936003 RepID=A0A1U9NP75_9BACT|nr:hypothetical protein [Anaerohalosphaera lusitana]AQT69316.1 hypothetical protein STSP2_02505 [Anaerohalosphaera lusitana]
MDSDKVYKKLFPKRFVNMKLYATILLIVGCLLNPIIKEVSYFIVGYSLAVIGIFLRLEKIIKSNIVATPVTKLFNDKMQLIDDKKGWEIKAKKHSGAVRRLDLDGESIFVFTPGIVVGREKTEQSETGELKESS